MSSIHHRQSEPKERGRRLEVAGVGSRHRVVGLEHVGTAADGTDHVDDRTADRLEATFTGQDPIAEIGRLVAAALGQLESLGCDLQRVVVATFMLRQRRPCDLRAPRRQGVVPAVGVFLKSGDGIVEGRPFAELEVDVDPPHERPCQLILEVRCEAEALEAVGDLQATRGVQRAGRDRVHRVQRFDEGTDIARSLGRAQVLLGLGAFRWHPGEIRRQHDHLALQARAEHGILADASKGVAAEVEQNRTGVVIGDPAHDERRFREESPVTGGSCLARHSTALRHGLGEEPGAKEASCPPDRQRAGTAVVLPCRDLGRALPEPGRALPVEGTLGGVGGIVERRERGLEAKDRHGAGPLLGDARAGRAGRTRSSTSAAWACACRLAVRSEVAMCLLAASRVNGTRPSSTTTRPWPCAMSRARRRSAGVQAADLDGELNVEAVAQHRQGLDRLGCRAAFASIQRTVVPE